MNWATWAFLRPKKIWRMVGELIGGSSSHLSMRLRNTMSTMQIWGSRDWSRTDYKFWDRARRSKAANLELSGLFLKPLGSKIAAWVMGDRPVWRLETPEANEKINEWWDTHHTDILRCFEESVDLGDCYLVINPDLSVAVIPPHVVSAIVDQRDFSTIIGWRIREKFFNPDNASESMIIEDEYYRDVRIRRWIRNGIPIRTQRFPNLIGRLPIIPVPNILGADEMFGRPEGEALIPALHKYGEVFDAAIKGNIRQGRATPVVQRMGSPEQVQKFWDLFGSKETVRNADGTTTSENVIDFDADQMLTLGGEAEFHWKSPQPFTKDTEVILQLLFYLLLQHTEIPEFAWGNAIASSKASAESQILPFMKWIEKKRGIAFKWMVEIVMVVSAYMRILNQITELTRPPDAKWRRLVPEDGRLTLDTVMWSWENGLLPDELAVELIPVEVDDPRAALIRARADMKRRRQIERDETAKDIMSAAEAQPDEEENTGLNRSTDNNRPQSRRASGNPQGRGENEEPEEEMEKLKVLEDEKYHGVLTNGKNGQYLPLTNGNGHGNGSLEG